MAVINTVAARCGFAGVLLMVLSRLYRLGQSECTGFRVGSVYARCIRSAAGGRQRECGGFNIC